LNVSMLLIAPRARSAEYRILTASMIAACALQQQRAAQA
jgi:hypothetical protein